MNFLSSFPAELFQGCAREAYTAGRNAQVHRPQVWRAADSLSSPSRPASVRAKQASLPRSRRLSRPRLRTTCRSSTGAGSLGMAYINGRPKVEDDLRLVLRLGTYFAPQS